MCAPHNLSEYTARSAVSRNRRGVMTSEWSATSSCGRSSVLAAHETPGPNASSPNSAIPLRVRCAPTRCAGHPSSALQRPGIVVRGCGYTAAARRRAAATAEAASKRRVRDGGSPSGRSSARDAAAATPNAPRAPRRPGSSVRAAAPPRCPCHRSAAARCGRSGA